MKITAVRVDTLELAIEEPFVIATSALAIWPCDLVCVETDEGITGIDEACPAYESTGDTLWTVPDVTVLANAAHCDADLPWRQGGMTHGSRQQVVDGVSWIDVPDAPGLGIELVEEHVGRQRVECRW